MKAKTFDKDFDNGRNIIQSLDLSKVHRPDENAFMRVSINFPIWMIRSLDREAKRLDVTRQSIIKIWFAEKLKEVSA